MNIELVLNDALNKALVTDKIKGSPTVYKNLSKITQIYIIL